MQLAGTRSILPKVRVTDDSSDQHLQLLKLLHRGRVREVGSILLSRKLDYDAWGDALIHGRMGVYVYALMQELNLLALLPSALSNRLQDQYMQQQQRNTALLGLLADVDHAFRDAGNAVVLLKGFPVAERFWGGIDRRFSMDLDLLCECRNLPTAVENLTEMGFAKRSGIPAAEALSMRLSHALEMTRGDLSLDLHWTLRNRPGIHFDLDQIQAGLECYRIGDIDCKVLSDQDQLLTLLVGLANDLERGHHRFRSLWDIYLLLHGMPQFDWQGFLADHYTEGVMQILTNVLALVSYRLDCRDEFPELVDTLDAHADLLLVTSAADADAVLSHRRQSLAGRQWFARMLPLPVWRYWLWWTTTVPLRFLLGRHI